MSLWDRIRGRKSGGGNHTASYGGTTDKSFNAKTVKTPCRTLMDAGYHLWGGIDVGAFEKARRLELQIINEMRDVDEAASRRGSADGEGAVTCNIKDHPWPKPKRDGGRWTESVAERESILRVRDYTGRPTEGDLLRDQLIEAYDEAGIPKLVQNFRRDREMTDAEELASEVVRSARSYVNAMSGKEASMGYHTAG